MKEDIMKKAQLSDDALDLVCGGSGDPFYYQSCTDFRCFNCGYQRIDPGETTHQCTVWDCELVNRCDYCEHLGNCSHGDAFMIEYRGM